MKKSLYLAIFISFTISAITVKTKSFTDFAELVQMTTLYVAGFAAICFGFSYLIFAFHHWCPKCKHFWAYGKTGEIVIKSHPMRFQVPYTDNSVELKKEKFVAEYRCIRCHYEKSVLKTRKVRSK